MASLVLVASSALSCALLDSFWFIQSNSISCWTIFTISKNDQIYGIIQPCFLLHFYHFYFLVSVVVILVVAVSLDFFVIWEELQQLFQSHYVIIGPLFQIQCTHCLPESTLASPFTLPQLLVLKFINSAYLVPITKKSLRKSKNFIQSCKLNRNIIKRSDAFGVVLIKLTWKFEKLVVRCIQISRTLRTEKIWKNQRWNSKNENNCQYNINQRLKWIL